MHSSYIMVILDANEFNDDHNDSDNDGVTMSHNIWWTGLDSVTTVEIIWADMWDAETRYTLYILMGSVSM